MSYQTYTVLESTNPELIAPDSTFVKEAFSDLIEIQDGKSHFLTNNNTMDRELIRLSLKHPEETFIAISTLEGVDFIFTTEYRNGECRELGMEPDYGFCYPSNVDFIEEERLAFQNHVLKYLRRLDIVKKGEYGFILDKLNNEKDANGYESYITITYENDQYKWTATKKGISLVEVSVEKKQPKVYKEKEFEDKSISSDSEDYGDLPF
jgi:hypothetical protein